MNCIQWIVTIVILTAVSTTSLHAQTCRGTNCHSNYRPTYSATPVVYGQAPTSWQTQQVTNRNPQAPAPVSYAPACQQQFCSTANHRVTSLQPAVTNPVNNSYTVVGNTSCNHKVVVSPPVATRQSNVSNAQPINQNRYVSAPNQIASQQYVTGNHGGLAQNKAQQAASRGIKGHVGGGMGSARYEGVGWSTASPQSAIQNCCYWGSRPVAQIGVARGNDGWYACVFYR